MPVISIFYGVTVLMYFFDNKRHKLPHIHVEHGSDEAVIEIHRDELMTNWERPVKGETVNRIQPLK